MKKILVTILLLISFGLITTNAGYSEKKVEETSTTNYDGRKSYEIIIDIKNLVNKYYYSIVFEKNNEKEIYSDIEKKVAEYNKYSIENKYSRETTVKEFLDYPNKQEIINTFGYHTIHYNSYNNNYKNSLFVKNHIIDLSEIKINDKIDGIYLGIRVNEIDRNRKYDYSKETKLKPIYTKYNTDKNVHFTKIDLEKYTGKIKIDITKIKKDIELKKSYNVLFNFYIKKGNNYVSIINNNINDYFSFDKYSIQSFLENKYRKENNPRIDYYSNNSTKEKLEEALNNKLRIIFDKIKYNKSDEEYLRFLENVKNKIISFSNDITKYEKLVENIKDEDSFNTAYKKYKKYKDQEKIINILLIFTSNEIYENTLEDTISDFIK